MDIPTREPPVVTTIANGAAIASCQKHGVSVHRFTEVTGDAHHVLPVGVDAVGSNRQRKVNGPQHLLFAVNRIVGIVTADTGKAPLDEWDSQSLEIPRLVWITEGVDRKIMTIAQSVMAKITTGLNISVEDLG